ncbi:MAG: hypothetical protein LBS21_02365 [Clostridiales bacterium]|jgi:ribosomal protein S27AE|nr:hypothetical protein [Clostridiales bacterium]
MLKNKTSDMTPFNMKAKPVKQPLFILPLIWAASKILTFGRLKIERVNMKGLRPPFLVLSYHQSFQDYYITPLSLFPHRANYVSDVEGFAAFGKWLYSKIGCIATRRYSGDVNLIRNILHAVNVNKNIVVVYPEARHSLVGTNSSFPESVGKLVKLLKLPVVVQKLYGSYLAQPVWDEKFSRKVKMRCELEKVLNPDQIDELSFADITALLNEHFRYDEYRLQYERRIKINYPKRAEGLHKALYLCPNCGAEEMHSQNIKLICGKCGKEWLMDEYGRLSAKCGITEFEHIPDWFEYQRGVVGRLIESGAYTLDIPVSVEALPNEKGFVALGAGRLSHGTNGFLLNIEKSGEALRFASSSLHSVHIEYDYRGRGDCVVLSTYNCCYYLYPALGNCSVTKIMLAGEQLHFPLCPQAESTN